MIMRQHFFKQILLIATAAIFGMSSVSCEKENPDNGKTPEKKEYTVSYNFNGAEGTAPESVKITEGSTITIEPQAPVRDGYDFGGWFTEATCINKFVFGPNGTKVTKDLTLYAKWTKQTVIYTVYFDLNGKTGTAPEALQIPEGGTIEDEPKVPIVTDFIFQGWYLEVSCTTAFVFGTNGTEISGNMTLYAKWEENIFTYVDGKDQPAKEGNTGEMQNYAGGVVITGIKAQFLESAKEIVIPDIIDGKPVYAIASRDGQVQEKTEYEPMNPGAFEYNQNVEKVVVGRNVKEIWMRAFRGAGNLKEISFADNSTIKIIGIGAFAECHSLKTITIPGSLNAINGWSKGAFFDCKNLVSVVMEPKTTRTERVPFLSTDNNQMPFIGAPVVITVPEAEKADYMSDPNWSKYSERINPSQDALNQPIFVKDGTVTGFTPKGMSQTELVIPASIDGNAITTFDNNAFSNNETITSLIFEGGNITFRPGAFVDQKALKTLKFLGAEPVKIEDWAFTNCGVLETIEFASTTAPNIPGIGLHNADGSKLSKVTAVYVPASAVDTYKAAMPKYSSVIQTK